MLNQITHHNLRITVVTPNDHLDALHAQPFWRQLETLFHEGNRHIVIDLSDVTFADSAAIAVLVRALKQARLMNGSLKLVWPTSNPARRIFDLTQFDQIFSLFPTVEDALQV